MDFTREPIIETVITPKEGCKLVVRSSKSSGQEEYFVDAVEVVSFGSSFFFRSLERPKAFLVPATDYELLEVRETRMVLKNVGLDRSIKIGGGREAHGRPPREPAPEKAEATLAAEEAAELVEAGAAPAESRTEGRLDKKRDRRRNYRRRRGREEAPAKEGTEALEEGVEEGTAGKVDLPVPRSLVEGEPAASGQPSTPSILSTLLPPPPNLISETIARYKDNALFRGAFFLKEDAKEGEEQEKGEQEEEELISDALPRVEIDQPEFGAYEMTEEEQEEIYRQRQIRRSEHLQPPPGDEMDKEESPDEESASPAPKAADASPEFKEKLPNGTPPE